MLKPAQFVFILIIGTCAALFALQNAHAQSSNNETTVFLPFVTGDGVASESDAATEPADMVLPGAEYGEENIAEVQLFSVEERKQFDAAPCGANTIALVHTSQRDEYVFCANGDGDVGVIELLRDGDESRSRLDSFYRPIDLFDAVIPPDQKAPAAVRRSIENGVAPQRATPYVIGHAHEFEADTVNASALSATCSQPSLGYSPQQAFFYDHTYCGDVIVGASTSNSTSWHQRTASALSTLDEGSHYHAGPHYPPIYYYADIDEEGDARFGRARVHSCGGTTVLRGWWKASPTTGSWSLVATFNVPAGATATMHVYGNPFQSVWMGYDADDIRFRADAQSGASFGSLFHFFKYAWGPNCQLKY